MLVDGLDFTGQPEPDEIYGANYISLDEIGNFENLGDNERLQHDPARQVWPGTWDEL